MISPCRCISHKCARSFACSSFLMLVIYGDLIHLYRLHWSLFILVVVVVVILFHLPISWVFILVSFSNPIEPDSLSFSLSIIFHSLCCYFGTLLFPSLSHTHAHILFTVILLWYLEIKRKESIPFSIRLSLSHSMTVCSLLDSWFNRFFISVI